MKTTALARDDAKKAYEAAVKHHEATSHMHDGFEATVAYARKCIQAIPSN